MTSSPKNTTADAVVPIAQMSIASPLFLGRDDGELEHCLARGGVGVPGVDDTRASREREACCWSTGVVHRAGGSSGVAGVRSRRWRASSRPSRPSCADPRSPVTALDAIAWQHSPFELLVPARSDISEPFPAKAAHQMYRRRHRRNSRRSRARAQTISATEVVRELGKLAEARPRRVGHARPWLLTIGDSVRSKSEVTRTETRAAASRAVSSRPSSAYRPPDRSPGRCRSCPPVRS